MTEAAPGNGARILPLGEIGEEPVGGKAEGLARLIAMGLDVPDGFVIVGATPGQLPEGLDEAYAAIGGGPVAVRSSAIGEDAADASFAGQFETILGVEGATSLRDAVDACLKSTASERATMMSILPNPKYATASVTPAIMQTKELNSMNEPPGRIRR